jgi:hypothetical protein
MEICVSAAPIPSVESTVSRPVCALVQMSLLQRLKDGPLLGTDEPDTLMLLAIKTLQETHTTPVDAEAIIRALQGEDWGEEGDALRVSHMAYFGG